MESKTRKDLAKLDEKQAKLNEKRFEIYAHDHDVLNQIDGLFTFKSGKTLSDLNKVELARFVNILGQYVPQITNYFEHGSSQK